MLDQIKFTTQSILNKTNNFKPQFGIILGTGLGGLVNEIKAEFRYPIQKYQIFRLVLLRGIAAH